MLVKASGKFLRISGRKARQTIDLIRGKDVNTALGTLSLLNKRSTEHINKILKAAIGNAKTKGLKPEQLYISKIIAEEGPIWKRYKAVAFGRAARIKKRTCHIKIELDTK